MGRLRRFASISAERYFCPSLKIVKIHFALALLVLLHAPSAWAQDTPDLGPLSIDVRQQPAERFKVGAVRTESPRDTLSTFVRLRDELENALLDYPHAKTAEKVRHIEFLFDQLISLIDLSNIPSASQREIGIYTMATLLDIFGRVGLPDLGDVPDEDAFDDEGFAQYRIPGTPIRIKRVEQGPRELEFLFNKRAPLVAPRFLEGIENEPLRSRLGIASWSIALPQFTGPMVPSSLVLAMPQSMLRLTLDTPLWKIVSIALLTAICGRLLAWLHRVLRRVEPEGRIAALGVRLIRPLALLVLVTLLIPFVEHEINTSGEFSRLIDSGTTLLVYLSSAWLLWLVTQLIAESIILSPRIPDESLDANLLRLVAGLIGVVGAIGLIAYCGQALGLPIMSIFAGLGIGGLAIALAIRPTLENLIGGFILYLDKPVRVGDYCTFGDQGGTVEAIGIRSTKLRALDQTLISVPNAEFANMQIINWSHNDVLISRVISLRYETDLDQLRYVLAKIREMLHAHPKIDSDTVRVRFENFAESSLDIWVRVFVKTREWNDYYAVQEDVLFRIGEIVKSSGAELAFPSQTLYIGRDVRPEQRRSEMARNEVANGGRSINCRSPIFLLPNLKRSITP